MHARSTESAARSEFVTVDKFSYLLTYSTVIVITPRFSLLALSWVCE